jgi:hypothetical protein
MQKFVKIQKQLLSANARIRAVQPCIATPRVHDVDDEAGLEGPVIQELERDILTAPD